MPKFMILSNTSLPVALFAAVTFISSAAYGKHWDAPDTGFIIQAQPGNGIPQHSGAQAPISGTITGVGIDNNPDHSNGHDHGNGDDNGHGDKDLIALFAKSNVQMHYFFPDSLHEVTGSVAVQAFNNRIQFNYLTPKLVCGAGAINTFQVLLTQLPDDLKAMIGTQEKINLRLAQVVDTIHGIKASTLPGNDLKNILALRDRLAKIADKIKSNLKARTETLAELRIPLQCDNAVAGPSYYSTVMGKYRFTIQPKLGTAIDGERTEILSTVTNLRKPDDDLDTDEDRDLWVVKFLWKGAQVQQIGPQPIPNGATISYTLQTQKLEPEDNNAFSVSLYDWDTDDHKVDKRFGMLSMIEPVSDDVTPPTWQPGSTPDKNHPFVQNMQPIFAQVNDSYGLIDDTAFNAILDGTATGSIPPTLPILPTSLDGIQALLTGILADGTPVNQDVTTKLSYLSPDQGQTFIIKGDLNPLPEGVYTFSLHAQDLAANSAVPDPLTSTFVIDRTPPVISNLSPSDGSTANMMTFVVSGRSNEPLSSARVNNVNLFLSPDRRSFSAPYSAEITGSVHLDWQFVDLAGNVTEVESNVNVPASLLNDDTVQIAANQSLLKVKVQALGTPDPSLSGIQLDFQGVSLVDNLGNEIVVDSTPVFVDFVALGEITRALLANKVVPAGSYQSIYLKLGDDNLVVQNGVAKPLSVPVSGKLGVTGPFILTPSRISQLQFTLQVDQAGIQASGGGYVLHPLLQQASGETLTQNQLRLVRGALGPRADAMLARADVIIQGQSGPSTVRSGAYNGSSMLFTNVVISVQDKLKGSPGSTVSLELLGGDNGSLAIVPTHVTQFRPSENFLLLLKSYPEGYGALTDGKIVRQALSGA